MNELSLFTGIGGGLLGTKLLGWRCIGAVDNDEYCCKVLNQRIKDECFEPFDIFCMDIREFNRRVAEIYQGKVDVLSLGPPCQGHSIEGKRLGEKDNRNMWPSAADTISIIKPDLILFENVPGIRPYLPVVIRDMRRLGYVVKKPCIVSAADCGFLHLRDRVWLLAYTNGNGWERIRDKFSAPAQTRLQTWAEFERLVSDALQSCVPSRGNRGIHDGIPNRVQRLRAIGNAQVPAVVKTVWGLLTGED